MANWYPFLPAISLGAAALVLGLRTREGLRLVAWLLGTLALFYATLVDAAARGLMGRNDSPHWSFNVLWVSASASLVVWVIALVKEMKAGNQPSLES